MHVVILISMIEKNYNRKRMYNFHMNNLGKSERSGKKIINLKVEMKDKPTEGRKNNKVYPNMSIIIINENS